MIIFTEKGRKRAEDVIRRHRLAERLFTQTFHVHDEAEVAEEACKFEHILSPEATERMSHSWDIRALAPTAAPSPQASAALRLKWTARLFPNPHM